MKIKFSYFLIGLLAFANGILWINVFQLFQDGLLGYVGGILAGTGIVGTIARSANMLPRVQSKRSRTAGTALLGLLVAVEPIVLGFANWPVVFHTTITLTGSYVVAGGASFVASLALVLGAVVDRSLVPAEKSKSEPKAKTKSAKRKKADYECRYAGAGCKQKFASQNAANAHARGCAYKPIAVDIET